MDYRADIAAFVPQNDRQRKEKALMQCWVGAFPDTILTRENAFAHMTASAMIFDADGEQVLMVYHRIYDSWAWSGGHADGEQNLMQTALREAEEETGITGLLPLSDRPTGLDILSVKGHYKHGEWVAPHLHLSLCYSFQGNIGAPLRIKQDENTGVQWIPIRNLEKYVSEKEMLPVYKQIIATTLALQKAIFPRP